MKVLHVIPSISERSGGPALAIIPMCRTLRSQGIDVTLATTDHEVSAMPSARLHVATAVQPGERHLYNDVPTYFFPTEWGGSFKFSRPFAEWLNSSVAEFDVVHIHAVFNHACIAAASACRKHRVPYIVRPLGTLDPWSMKQKPWRKSLFWQVTGKKMLRNAAAVHYTARAEQEATERSLGLDHGEVIPLGIDLDAATVPLSIERFGARFPSFAKNPYVLVLSRLHPKKGLDVLIDAFLTLAQQERFATWRLVLAGEGPADYVTKLKAKVLAMNGTDKIVFPGWLEGEVKQTVLSQASLLALPSYQENFGVCVLEALASGVPVLVSPHVNLAEDIAAAGAGWIAKVEAGDLVNVLDQALGSESERRSRGKSGALWARKFDWAAVARQLIELYAQVSLSSVRQAAGSVA